LIYYYRN